MNNEDNQNPLDVEDDDDGDAPVVCPFCRKPPPCAHVLLSLDESFGEIDGSPFSHVFAQRVEAIEDAVAEDATIDFDDAYQALIEEVERLANTFERGSSDGGAPGMSSAMRVFYIFPVANAKAAAKQLALGLPPHEAVPDDLKKAYRATRYDVTGKRPVTFRVRDAKGAHDDWLNKTKHGAATVITAMNPFGVQAADDVNVASNAALRDSIDKSRLKSVPARGAAADGSWAEDGFCVFDASEHWVRASLQEFRQHAALRVNLGGRPKLVWHPKFVPWRDR